MSVTFQIEGLQELRDALRALPEDLTGEATHIVEAATNGAVATIKSVYGDHVVTGDLVNKLESTVERSGFGVVGTVRSKSKLAYIFEEGSEARHYITVRGNEHLTGKMPAIHVFVPTLMMKRRQMWQQLSDLLERNGLEVSGAPE